MRDQLQGQDFRWVMSWNEMILKITDSAPIYNANYVQESSAIAQEGILFCGRVWKRCNVQNHKYIHNHNM